MLPLELAGVTGLRYLRFSRIQSKYIKETEPQTEVQKGKHNFSFRLSIKTQIFNEFYRTSTNIFKDAE
jgi:hypothetical protein